MAKTKSREKTPAQIVWETRMYRKTIKALNKLHQILCVGTKSRARRKQSRRPTKTASILPQPKYLGTKPKTK